MKCFLLMIALYGALSSALPLNQEIDDISEKDMELAKKYMENYYPESESTPVLRSKKGVDKEKIKQMQNFLGLKVTGKLDSSTLEAMKKPRCGVPDIAEYRTFPMSPKWEKKDLTYSIQNYTPDMERADVDNAIERALKMWSDVTPLTFTRVSDSSADIEISFASRYHGDFIPFDGQGGQLAHAYSPAYGGNAHFDEDETWMTSSTGINLFIVAAHEFGHSLGLYHSRELDSLMFPTYQFGDPQTLTLHRDDIEGIQHLYGPPEEDNGEPETPTEKNEQLLADSCDPNLTFDAVVSLRGETIFFKNRFFWRKNPLRREVEKDPISAFWPTLNHGIDAAYEDEDNDTVFLFKGHKYWATKGNIIQPGFPKNIHSLGFPKTVKSIDAAFYDRSSKKTYLFAGSNYWRYDKTRNFMENPRSIKTEFHEVGPQVDAAFLHNGRIYLFRGSLQYEYDSRTNQFLGRKKTNSWFGCH
ncbi:stromelysin-2-like [Anolis sagrei]|uniref:stromelysin-2-like n=1 Tax=Anolis sagrei TaxID=38937 RepID=UPI003522E886